MHRSALCRFRRELSNAYLLAKFGFDTAENEPSKVCRIPRRHRPYHQYRRAAGPESSWGASLGWVREHRVPGLRRHGIRQTLEGSFSAVSKPNFASKYAFESSRRDLHNALLCTAFGIHNRKLGEKRPGQNNPRKVKTRGD